MELNKKLDKILENKGNIEDVVLANIDIFINFSEILHDAFLNAKFEEDESVFSKMDLFTKIKHVENFYKEKGIDFNINKYINDGTINFVYLEERIVIARNSYVEGKRSVEVANTGTIDDALLLVHELNHLRSQPEDGRSVLNNLLTEVFAYFESLVFLDYLEEIGYKEYSIDRKRMMANDAFNTAAGGYMVFKAVNVYNQLGDFNKNSYKLLYNTDYNYELVEKNVHKFNEEKPIIILSAFYTLGFALSIYIYQKYLEDKSLFTKMNNLNDILEDITMEDFLREIDLIDFREEDLVKIELELNEFKKSIKKEKIKEKKYENKKIR